MMYVLRRADLLDFSKFFVTNCFYKESLRFLLLILEIE
jgi:hypothetical protein